MTSDARVAEDPVGAATLETMARAHRYNAWQLETIAPFLGRRVCEIGSGIGNMSRLLAGLDHELLLLTDQSPDYLDCLRSRFGADPRIAIEPLGLPDPAAVRDLSRYRLDTVVAFNVLEHIPDDAGALDAMAGLLSPGGAVVLLVPALPLLYGSLDRGLQHVRRYDPAGLRRTMVSAGLRVTHLRYFNALGALGWLWSARVLRAQQISPRQVAVFDRLVPLLRMEKGVRLPFGQSLIAVGERT